MRLSSKSPSANPSTASLHSRSPTLQHNIPSSAPHLDQNKPGCGSRSSSHLHTRARSHHSTALCQLLYSTKPGERHCSFKDAALPSAQLSARLLQHYRQGKHRQWQQAGWKPDNRFIWQSGFLNEQQPPEELHPDMPNPSALTKALNKQRGTC